MKLTKKEYNQILKNSNDWWYKADKMLQELEKDNLVTWKNKEIILDWDNANDKQQWRMRRFKEFRIYYNQCHFSCNILCLA